MTSIDRLFTDMQFWLIALEESRRTVVCSPELESRIKTRLASMRLDHQFTVKVSRNMVDDKTILLIDENAITAAGNEVISNHSVRRLPLDGAPMSGTGCADPEVWERPPAADAVRLDVVFDEHLGVIASATSPTGQTATAAEAPRLCPSCNGSGYASTIDGRTLGTCSTCAGWGSFPDKEAAGPVPEPTKGNDIADSPGRVVVSSVTASGGAI